MHSRFDGANTVYESLQKSFRTVYEILCRSIANTSLVGLLLVLEVYPESEDRMAAQGEHVLAAIQVVRIDMRGLHVGDHNPSLR